MLFTSRTVAGRSKTKRAAVTMITDETHIILIRRKVRDDDPWSGHIAFPGGYVKSGETDLDASMRECMEEIGFLPTNSRFYGTYTPHIRNITVSAFLDVESISKEYVAGDEVDDVFVVSFSDLIASTNENNFPCYVADGKVIWGLTYRILQDYLQNKDNNR